MSTKIGSTNPLSIQFRSNFYMGDPTGKEEPNNEVSCNLETSQIFSPMTLPPMHQTPGGLFIPGMETKPRFSFPEVEEPKYQTIRIPVEELIESLEELGKEKTRMTFGFHPMPLYDEFEVKWGEKALLLAHKLKDDLSSPTVEEAVSFLGASEMIQALRVIAKIGDKTQLGINPPPIPKEKREMTEKANSLSTKLLNNPNETTFAETGAFLTSRQVIKTIKDFVSKSVGSGEAEENETIGVFGI